MKSHIFAEPFYVYEAMIRYCTQIVKTTLDCRKCPFRRDKKIPLCDERYAFAQYRRGLLKADNGVKPK